MMIDRRQALGLLAAGAMVPASVAAAPDRPGAVGFVHGVASGDPTAHGAILWTRVTPADAASTAPVEVEWHVAAHDGDRPIASGRTQARAARDFTVKVDPSGLRPGTEYSYWFVANGIRSPSGRVRTLPRGPTDRVVLAVVSCSLYPGGLFNAYDAISKLDRVDAVLHLGDYIYEYGREEYGSGTAERLGRLVEPPHETVTLADYRQRHAFYKRDPDLQAAHARTAMIAVWDDHETANDSWTGGAENHQPATEGDWSARKAAAMQAYFEWMPIRDPIPGRPWEAINRSFRFGDLAQLLMVETRLLARSHQAVPAHMPPSAADFAAMVAERDRPDREMLGETQRHWLQHELTASVAARMPWQVLGNQVVMARVAGPDLAQLPAAARAAIDTLAPAVARQVTVAQASYRAGLPYNLDSWDGYPPARERLYASFRAAGSRPLVLSGDSHAFWANDLHDGDGTLVAAEFGVSSITSPSIGDALPQVPLGALLEHANDEVAFCDQRAKGFILLTLTHAAAKAEYMAVSTILARPYALQTLATFQANAGNRTARLQRV